MKKKEESLMLPTLVQNWVPLLRFVHYLFCIKWRLHSRMWHAWQKAIFFMDMRNGQGECIHLFHSWLMIFWLVSSNVQFFLEKTRSHMISEVIRSHKKPHSPNSWGILLSLVFIWNGSWIYSGQYSGDILHWTSTSPLVERLTFRSLCYQRI